MRGRVEKRVKLDRVASFVKSRLSKGEPFPTQSACIADLKTIFGEAVSARDLNEALIKIKEDLGDKISTPSKVAHLLATEVHVELQSLLRKEEEFGDLKSQVERLKGKLSGMEAQAENFHKIFATQQAKIEQLSEELAVYRSK